MPPSDAAIINITMPVFNRPELTFRTINALRNSKARGYTLTVVDNGSERDVQELLCKLKEVGKIDFLYRLDRNYGVSVAANLGWRLQDKPLYMKLDNDIVIKNKHWLEELVAFMKKEAVDAIWGGDFHNQLHRKEFVRFHNGVYGRTKRHVSGAAIFIPRSVSSKLGYWSEDYGLYGCEDGDYGCRMSTGKVVGFYFDHTLYMEHCGDDNAFLEKRYGLQKQQTQDYYRHLFATNLLLYVSGVRPLKIPPCFIPDATDGYAVTMKKNASYAPIYEAVLLVHEAQVAHGPQSQEFAAAIRNLENRQTAFYEKAEEDAAQAYAGIVRALPAAATS